MPHLLHTRPVPNVLNDVEGGAAARLIDEKYSSLLKRIRKTGMLKDQFRRYVALGGV